MLVEPLIPSKTCEVSVNIIVETFFKPVINKACPFKKVFVCILPIYHTEDQEEYKQIYYNVLR